MRRFFAFVLILLASTAARATTVRVAVAISLKEAVTEIGKSFESDSGDKVEFTFGSSGQLQGQIKNGAELDLFISAANKQVDELTHDELVAAETRRVVAGNSLVLVVPADAKDAPSSFEALADPSVKRLATGEPKTVPAGQYTAQVLKKLGLTDKLADRLVYGANVRQVLGYVERGEVTAGIVYLTDAKESGDKVKVVATAAPDTHDPIVYPAVVIKASKQPDAAKRFLDYLGSEKARDVLTAKGFSAGADVPADKKP